MVGNQIAVGTIELAALALVPAILIPSLSAISHRSYPLPVALHFSVLWFFCGLVIFAASFLLSVVTPGEYTAPVVCSLALVLHTFVAAWHPLAGYRLNLMWIMGEFQAMRWNAAHSLLKPPPLSWAANVRHGILRPPTALGSNSRDGQARFLANRICRDCSSDTGQ